MDASWDSSYLLDGQEIDKINICLLSDYMESQYFFLITMLRTLDQLVKYHGDGAQDNDGSDDHIELEEMQNVGERDRHGSLLV